MIKSLGVEDDAGDVDQVGTVQLLQDGFLQPLAHPVAPCGWR
ncbi:hypothetical protein [Streptomyces sp. NPDC055692]